tara:strand:+ start:30342 stop:30944 length:603 start_codon:yes stop_codon:yes gene_type:complete
MPDTPRAYIVDDDSAALKSLLALLRARRIDAKGFSSGEEFLKEYDLRWCGCAILDVRMPGMSGIELLAELKEMGSSLSVILVTAYGDVSLAVEAMKAGAIDFLEKPYSQEELLAALVRGFDVGDAAARKSEMRADAREKLEKLTNREKEVLELLAQGMTSKEIAQQFGRSPRTVEVHRNRIREKTGAQSLSDLVRLIGAA